MKKILPLLFLSILLSCDDDFQEAFVIDNGTHITLKNASGDNLFDTSAYNPEDFRIYNIINGQAEEVNEPNLDYPRNFMMIEAESGKVMRLFLNPDPEINLPETIVKWNNVQADTLKAEFRHGNSFHICQKVWLNGNLVWQAPSTDDVLGRDITIVK